MIPSSNINTASLMVYAGCFTLVATTLFARAYRRRHPVVTLAGAPLLLSYYTDGAALDALTQGRLGNLYYYTFATNQGAALIYRVELPFTANLHLLGIPKASAGQFDPASGSSLMERVDLEGDYSNYFTLFTEHGQQTQARYALDPKAMVFTVDFCRSHSWEIINNELYFVQSGKTVAGDPTNAFDDIATFVDQIKPALARPASAQEVINTTPYGEDRRTALPCPLCQKPMKHSQLYYSCPDGHGILLMGQGLQLLRRGQLAPLVFSDKLQPHGALTCPACSHPMSAIAYDGSAVTIDSCTHCAYRWLDATEAAKIAALAH